MDMILDKDFANSAQQLNLFSSLNAAKDSGGGDDGGKGDEFRPFDSVTAKGISPEVREVNKTDDSAAPIHSENKMNWKLILRRIFEEKESFEFAQYKLKRRDKFPYE